MPEFRATVTWNRKTPDFSYEGFDRTHQIRFGGGTTISASSAPEYLGKPEHVNPEEQFAGSLSSCHMLTFLAIAAKKKLVVDSYEDQAVAVLGKHPTTGRTCITEVILNPRVVFSGTSPDPATLRQIHDKAHDNCMVANSISARVRINAV